MLLLIGLLLGEVALAGEVAVSAHALLQANSSRLDGEVALTLQAEETLYQVTVAVIQRTETTPVLRRLQWSSGLPLDLPVSLPREHRWPGEYHLLLEIRAFDRAGHALTLVLSLPYQYQAQRSTIGGPSLVIDGARLRWDVDEAAVRIQGVDISSGPHWDVLDVPTLDSATLALRQRPASRARPDHRYPQIAVINYLDPQGFHHSRVVHWSIDTDARGQWWQQPRSERTPAFWPLSPMAWIWMAWALSATLLLRWKMQRGMPLASALSAAAVLALCIGIMQFTELRLWFTPTWVSGGDTASHVLYVEKFRSWFFEGRITGWMPEVFAGYPAFRYYFPLPFAVAAMLSLLMPLAVAFKLSIMLPAVLLPAAVSWMGQQFRWSPLERLGAAICSVGFLLHTGSSIWGGNLLALLAGEFAYAWGMLFTVIFWGAMIRALRLGGRAWIWACLAECLVAMSHGYALLVAGFSSALLPLLFAQRWSACWTVFKVHLVAFLLLGFWLLPLLEFAPLTIPNDTSALGHALSTYFPQSIWLILLTAPLAVLVLMRRQDAGGIHFFLGVSLLGVLAYALAPVLKLADIRFFPYTQLSLCIALGAAGACWLRQYGRNGATLGFAVFACSLLWVWSQGPDTIRQWARWNFEGYERKAMWPVYKALAEHLQGGTHEPRILLEHHPDNADLGSTRATEALPLFGSRPVLEGLYMESAITSPFVYQLQAEVSAQPSAPLSRFPVVKGIQGDIAERLRDVYADTIVVRSPDVADWLAAQPGLRRDGEIGPFSVFRTLEPPRLIEAAGPVIPHPLRDDWLAHAYQHFILNPPRAPRPVYGLPNPPPDQRPGESVRIELRDFSDEQIRFTTSHPGVPHLLRVAYHPAWRSQGGEPIYKTSPAFMVLVPERHEVELVFDQTAGQRLGPVLSLAGLILLGVLAGRAPAQSMQAHRGLWLAAYAGLAIAWLLAYLLDDQRAYTRAQQNVQAGRHVEAARQFRDALASREHAAGRAEALFWAARSHALAGQPAQARAGFRELLETYPASYWAPESLYRLSQLLVADGQPELAARYRARLRQQFPRNQWTGMLNAAPGLEQSADGPPRQH